MSVSFDRLTARLARISPQRRVGRIASLGGGAIRVAGLSDVAALGDRVTISDRCGGEVVELAADALTVMADDATEGLAIDDPVLLEGAAVLSPDDSWIGRVIDPLGRPLDDRPLMEGPLPRSLRAAPPPPAHRRPMGARLATGMAVFDTLLPLVRGQRIGLFAGSGVGKSTLLAGFARGVQADLVVIALVGERGREVREFVEHVLGAEGMARAVVVAATSDRSPAIRRRCALAAMTVAEHFRDRGLHVLLLADSITRFAEAHREMSVAGGEAASLRGYPPSTSHAIMSLAERAGPGAEGQGDITAVFSVLVAGSNMEEPVADILRGTIDGHVVMDRSIAERGRFPAVDLLRSVSRSLPKAATPAENAQIARARQVLGAWDRAEMMVQAGLYAKGSDPQVDLAVRLWPKLDAFLAESSSSTTHAFQRLEEALR
ncbi:FliI/YscN family ATPase [Falsirhodobacter sp. 20TX0035]|uniref:FliI/YscN family ATPase n=1 Tax=Falsirhodobacter sp. 20TX0035 TaxID=3022019 RepID=UPI00232FFAC3|nr:FliI/YscN family ATPase [Falsirhodobacter sp. 20TX0035]MDB6452491.1 FliI/YscN family ATPase [Falsirhodobacter sp. 20TX0035]